MSPLKCFQGKQIPPFQGIDSEMASDYCWIHGSSYIPPQYQKHLKCIVDLDGVESADDAPDTSYYQVI